MTLYIESSDYNAITYSLTGKLNITKIYVIDPHETHKALGLMQKFLKSAEITTGDIKKIVVCTGPGSFTGVRVGIAHAQALGFAWNVPVIAIEKPKFLEQFQKNFK